MKDHLFAENYSNWSSLALISSVMLLAAVALVDIVLGLHLSSSVYMIIIVVVAIVMTLLSVTWISVLNSKLFGQDVKKETLDTKPVHEEKEEEVIVPIAPRNRQLTKKIIEDCIRREGYIPTVETDRVWFKREGDVVEIFYDESSRLNIRLSFLVDGETEEFYAALDKACVRVQRDIICIRNYVFVTEDDQPRRIVLFEIASLTDSADDFEKHFPHNLSILFDALSYNRNILNFTLGGQANAPAAESPATVPEGHNKKVLS